MDNKGFTLVEVTMAAVIIAFVAAGVWGVYWSVVNTYYVEQRDSNIQAEGDRILDMIENGGFAEGRRVFGLNSMVPVENYPRIGQESSTNFSYWDNAGDTEACDPVARVDRADYRIEFVLDAVSGNTRWAEYAVQLYECGTGPTGDPGNTLGAKAILYFRLRTEGTVIETDTDHNYQVKLTENLLQRKSGTDPDAFGDYDMTWFKAQLLPKDPSTNRCTGIKVSFYLNDSSQPVSYNYNLDRRLESPTGNPDQDRSFMGAIPYPKYFSTTVYFPNGG